MANEAEPKWEGKACAKLTGPTADQVWPLLEDFFSLHKWLPGIDTCYQVEGVSGQPGCIRYCANTTISSEGNNQEKIVWIKEKLLAIDSIKRCFSYQVIDGNMGLNSYIATITVEPADENDNEGGCKIKWSFVVDPVEGWRFEDLVSYVDSSLQVMAKRMEEALQPSK